MISFESKYRFTDVEESTQPKGGGLDVFFTVATHYICYHWQIFGESVTRKIVASKKKIYTFTVFRSDVAVNFIGCSSGYVTAQAPNCG